jgi:hypothetical protein
VRGVARFSAFGGEDACAAEEVQGVIIGHPRCPRPPWCGDGKDHALRCVLVPWDGDVGYRGIRGSAFIHGSEPFEDA